MVDYEESSGIVMNLLARIIAMAVLSLWTPDMALAEEKLIESFEDKPETRWRFIADDVMGGVSEGDVEFVAADSLAYARMTGTVSTENNGGFIQFRMKLSSPLPEGANGLRLIVRGNEQRYFVHLRTSGTILPWQYYQAGFEASQEWREVRLSFTDFQPSGSLLRDTPVPETVKSIGVVAFGRDHQAEIEVREVGYF